MSWHGLRQQHERPAGKPNCCLADFVAGKASGVADYIGAFAVTAGLDIEERLAAYERSHDDYHAIMLKALADRFAEAAAEWPARPACARSSGPTPRPRRWPATNSSRKPTAVSARPPATRPAPTTCEGPAVQDHSPLHVHAF